MKKSFFSYLANNPWIELGARWILGIIFIIGCFHKITDPSQFAKIIYGYKLLPAATINLVAIVLPFVELFAGLALILGIYPRSAALTVNFMLLAFMTAISINLIRGLEFDCGCFSFGKGGYRSSALQLFFRDFFFFLLGLQVCFFDAHRKWALLSTGGIRQKRSE
jgi:uncharacterized membrane protein YphA (DoxX/SURF4 family)